VNVDLFDKVHGIDHKSVYASLKEEEEQFKRQE
jgi:hypothetical protein